MLDSKINNEQEMEIVEEDAAAMARSRADNKEHLIRAQIRQSQLKKANERVDADLEQKTEENGALIKSNEDLEAENEKLDTQIKELVQRVDLNTLLREVDLQDLALQAQNNQTMNVGFMTMLQKWEHINNRAE